MSIPAKQGLPGHEMILASAGTGKTYQLALRYLKLLHLTGAPERIAALTFTRKAAGEFHRRITGRLAKAAQDDAEAARLAAELGIAATRDDFLRHLRRFIERSDRLLLATLDSFFGRIARSFPFELGLAGPVTLLDPVAGDAVRRRAQDALFAGGARAGGRAAFWHAFKRATAGREEKTMAGMVDRFVSDYHDLLLEAGNTGCWGGETRIWGPRGCPWKVHGHMDLPAAAQALRDGFDRLALGKGQRTQLGKFCTLLGEWKPGADLPSTVKTILDRCLDAWKALEAGAAEIPVGRGAAVPLEGALAQTMADVVRFIVWSELEPRIAETRGIHDVVRAFEEVYDATVRRAGVLTFGDIKRLLACSDGCPTHGMDPARRALLDYRIDGAFDHWLFDEFQDTDPLQWRVVAELVDEVVQDPSGTRTLFYVGDVKQSLYLWRNSDDRLFFRVRDRYPPGTIAERTLSCSHRSSPPVLDMVNAVFDRRDVIAGLFNSPVADRWSRGWVLHEVDAGLEELPGAAVWIEADGGPGARAACVCRLLNELKPLERGLTAAVLVRKNEQATALADRLRASGGPPVVSTSDFMPAADNPAGAAVCSLLALAAHPGDRFAPGHLRLTPVAGRLESLKGGLREAAADVRQAVHLAGFEAALRMIAGWMAPLIAAGGAFPRMRMDWLCDTARLFDEGGSRDIDEFLSFAKARSSRDATSRTAVSILTIHKAKGLDFDIIILPEMENAKTLHQRRRGIAVRRNDEGGVEWVLVPPDKEIALGDPVLGAFVQEAADDAAYEGLCQLYVAMTRAKRGLYMITGPVEAGKDPATTQRLLARTLGTEGRRGGADIMGGTPFPVLWSAGDPCWHRKVAPKPAEKAPDGIEAFKPPAGRQGLPRLGTQKPSDAGERSVSGKMLFSSAGAAAASHGTAVHAVFERIEWLTGDPARDEALVHAAGAAAGAPAEAVAEVLGCLARQPEARAAFLRPPGGAELWRERAFEVILDGRLIGGVFDRVVLRRAADGVPAAATVYDFKTDRTAGAEELAAAVDRHRPQVEIYRRVLSVLTGLPPGSVEGRLIFTRGPQP